MAYRMKMYIMVDGRVFQGHLSSEDKYACASCFFNDNREGVNTCILSGILRKICNEHEDIYWKEVKP